MKRHPLFFIALLPPAELQVEVTAFKELIARKWRAVHALKSPPHLTLQPPFEWPQKDLPALKICLRVFAHRQAPFPVQLDNFGAFPPRVVFVQPTANPSLQALFTNLIECLNRELRLNDTRNYWPFHPHMTIAHRDLKESYFPAVWDYFKSQSFQRDFTATSISLLASVRGKWEVIADFPFPNRPAER